MGERLGELRRILHREPRRAAPILPVNFDELPDATPEEVKARREASAAKNGRKAKYEVDQELVVPNRFHTGETLLAPISVLVASYGGGTFWSITASLMPTEREIRRGSQDQTILGKAIYEGKGISTEEALSVANDWVRDSAVWVPHQQEIPMHPDVARFAGSAYYLLRGN